ncbi:MAG: hypothetical protein Aurels2KO_05190 [Aureliella sp.]
MSTSIVDQGLEDLRKELQGLPPSANARLIREACASAFGDVCNWRIDKTHAIALEWTREQVEQLNKALAKRLDQRIAAFEPARDALALAPSHSSEEVDRAIEYLKRSESKAEIEFIDVLEEVVPPDDLRRLALARIRVGAFQFAKYDFVASYMKLTKKQREAFADLQAAFMQELIKAAKNGTPGKVKSTDFAEQLIAAENLLNAEQLLFYFQGRGKIKEGQDLEQYYLLMSPQKQQRACRLYREMRLVRDKLAAED